MITKKEINENTEVRHIGYNKYSYHYKIDNLVFRGDGSDFGRVTVEDTEIKPGQHAMIGRIGYAQHKKQFVDIVYNYLKEYNYDNRS